MEGLAVRQVERLDAAKGPVVLQMNEGDQLRNLKLSELSESPFVTVDLTALAQSKLEPPLGESQLTVAGVPFELAGGGQSVVDLRTAKWIDQKQDPADYYENYEGGAPVINDPRVPFLRVPSMDYVAVHVLAAADDDLATTPNFTLRAGRYGHSDQVVFHSFPATAPRLSEAAKVPAGSQAPGGKFFHVRVPWTEAFSQDIEGRIEIELTKEIRLARRQPDPCRFRSRPLGLPSGVRIAGLTLERSPLQMRVSSKVPAHAFAEPQVPTFQIRLDNITAAEQAYALTLALTGRDGAMVRLEQKGTVAANKLVELELAGPLAKRGYHDVTVTLSGPSGVLLERRTTCCLLPADTRKHRESSPFGTWDFCGGHFTANNPDETGPLYVKLGLRYGMYGFKPEIRKQYGVISGSEPNIFRDGLKTFEDFRKSTPDSPPIGLIFHETSVSGKHLTRVPDVFSDLPPYKFDEAEQKVFADIHGAALQSAREIKAKYPRAHLRLGNGALPTKEAMYQAKFPAELFDSAGNEAPAFGRPPEAQPPDCVAYNASIWMDRFMLDAYGYKDKPVTECLETCYPATNPGNLTLDEQADYLVRHSLHALAWDMPQIKIGQICDMGNGYYFSNWGAIGFTRPKPELNVKPSFVAVATMTRVLDGAKFARAVPLGSESLYGFEFTRPDGTQATAFWTLRGKRTVRLQMDRPGPWILINDQAFETPVTGADQMLELQLSSSPVYLVGAGKVAGAGAEQKGVPVYADKPAGKGSVLASLGDLADWKVEEGRDPEIEFYDFMCPRRKGDFAFTPEGAFEGREKVLKIVPGPIKHGKETMPMYSVLAHKQGIPVPGTPTEVGAWVNGNSGWGRLIFELHDASGQRWISLGADQPDIPRAWIEQMVPADLLAKWPKPGLNDWNTGDVYGRSRINFDGWRWLSFALPGNYPGENHPWPANSQWRWDKDGVVHYPLTFRRLIVELPEKVLQLKSFAPPVRPEIYLKDLSVGQDEQQFSYVLGPDR